MSALSTVQSADEWPWNATWPVWKLTTDQFIYMHGDFCLVFTAPAKWRVNLRAKIGQYRNTFFYQKKVFKAISKTVACYPLQGRLFVKIPHQMLQTLPIQKFLDHPLQSYITLIQVISTWYYSLAIDIVNTNNGSFNNRPKCKNFRRQFMPRTSAWIVASTGDNSCRRQFMPRTSA